MTETTAVTAVQSHMRLPFALAAGIVMSRFCSGIRVGEIHGNRCPVCEKVFVPPRDFCGRCWERCRDWTRVRDTGTVATFVVVNVPFYGQQVTIPYVLGHVLLDGADTTVQHLIGVVGADGRLSAVDTRLGLRVRAVWTQPSSRTGYLNDDVDHFEPTGEPDRDTDEFREHIGG
jgi:uncharacterized OB-fold protein